MAPTLAKIASPVISKAVFLKAPKKQKEAVKIPHCQRKQKAMLSYPLYFMKEKSKWGKAGVAFIVHQQDKDTKTYARKYLIADGQFWVELHRL